MPNAAKKPAQKGKPEVKREAPAWAKRLRAHIKEHKISRAVIIEKMGTAGYSGSGIRHWLNGTREPNLSDFLRLCTVTDADPAVILFGGPCLSPESVPPHKRADFQSALDALIKLTKQA